MTPSFEGEFMPITQRDHAILAAEKYITSGAYILDIKTTRRGNSEIVEITIIRADGTILMSRLVKPSRPMPAAATAIHGITDGDVENAPIWPDIWLDVKRLIGDRCVIACNSPFARDMIANSCGRYPTLIENAHLAPIGLGTRWVDLMELWQCFSGLDHRVSLAKACTEANVKVGAHRALADAEAARQLLHFIAEQKLMR